ncbi:MAG: DUF1805 domain-containing protein [Archaeoglobaceae archaeon]|nr:DUF1805 domain-containing protein [Archaeoglobaceae archaeon]MDW8117549.1 DUF1805 domain-containing protein [Archaeoglobaceae archaeon]
MILVDLLEIKGKKIIALKVELPKAPLLLMLYKDLIIGCGYINPEAMEKFENSACIVRGVRSFEDMLNAEIVEITSKARELGAEKGMKVFELLEKLEF